MPRIEIVAVPPGEAPERVRVAWVGTVLPLASSRVYRGWTSGVVTAARTPLGRFWARLTGRWSAGEGYVVDAREAVAVLAVHRPEAARWWVANTPHLLASGRKLLFPVAVCRRLPEE